MFEWYEETDFASGKVLTDYISKILEHHNFSWKFKRKRLFFIYEKFYWNIFSFWIMSYKYNRINKKLFDLSKNLK